MWLRHFMSQQWEGAAQTRKHTYSHMHWSISKHTHSTHTHTERQQLTEKEELKVNCNFMSCWKWSAERTEPDEPTWLHKPLRWLAFNVYQYITHSLQKSSSPLLPYSLLDHPPTLSGNGGLISVSSLRFLRQQLSELRQLLKNACPVVGFILFLFCRS